jgi:hypothetical protein
VRLTGGDGVVPLSSQLAPRARAQFTDIKGLEAGHADALHDAAAVDQIVGEVERVKSIFPEDHLHYLAMADST